MSTGQMFDLTLTVTLTLNPNILNTNSVFINPTLTPNTNRIFNSNSNPNPSRIHGIDASEVVFLAGGGCHRDICTGKKVKFSHTRYRALGPELIPVYRQSARR